MPDLPQESTRESLIVAGLHLFGHKGYAATSTRELAARAGTNVASIAYHFGSKSGLRLACAEAVAERVQQVIGSPQDHGAIAPARAEAALDGMLRAMATFLITSRAAEDIVTFILREVTESGPALDTVYAALIKPKHRELCALWAAATGQEAESAEVRLTVFSMMGQLLYFRIGKPVVQRRMGWSEMGPDEARQIAEVLSANLHSTIERSRR